MKKLNPKKVFIIANSGYREITPAEHEFGKKPMHFFGLWGSAMFFIGFIALVIVLSMKLISMYSGDLRPLVTSSPYFYISLTAMILGTQMFLAGFIGELISRNSPNRNNYKIEDEI